MFLGMNISRLLWTNQEGRGLLASAASLSLNGDGSIEEGTVTIAVHRRVPRSVGSNGNAGMAR